MVKRHHLVGKVADNDAGPPRTIIVSGVHSHSRSRDAIFAESHARRYCIFSERSVAVVQVKFVGLSVIGDQKIRPAVTVVVKYGDPKAFRYWVIKAGFFRRVFEFAIAKVVP